MRKEDMQIEEITTQFKQSIGDYYIEIDRTQLNNLPTSLSDLLSKQMKIVVLRNMIEPTILKERLLRIIGDQYGRDFELASLQFFDNLIVPSPEVIAALVTVSNDLRESKFLSVLFADLVKSCGFPEPIVIDGGILRFYFPQHYNALRCRKDLFKATDFISYPPHDEAGLPLCSNLSVGPHRDVDIPMASLPINFWFPLQKIPKWRSLLFFPEALRKPLSSFPKGLAEHNPHEWGYGQPLQFDLNVGDIILFHCEHFHSTPWSDLDPRLSGEVRVVGGCIDDHSSYRRTFSNLNNFLVKELGNSDQASLTAADSLLNQINWNSESPHFLFQTPFSNSVAYEVFASCFKSLEDARRSLCTFESDAIFKQQPISINRLSYVFKILKSWKPFSEDRLLAFARLFATKGDFDSAKMAFSELLHQTQSYFWCFECGRYALKYGCIQITEDAFTLGLSLSQQSTVRVFRFYSQLPTSDDCRQILPADATLAMEELLAYCRGPIVTKSLFKKPSIKWYSLCKWFGYIIRGRCFSISSCYMTQLVDAQLFLPHVRIHKLDESFHGHRLYACAAFKIFVAIPQAAGEFNPKTAIQGKYKIYLQADSEQELIDMVWRHTRLKMLFDIRSMEDLELKMIDRSVRCQIFKYGQDIIVAPNETIKTKEDIDAALVTGNAVKVSTISEARNVARCLQIAYWPVAP